MTAAEARDIIDCDPFAPAFTEEQREWIVGQLQGLAMAAEDAEVEAVREAEESAEEAGRKEATQETLEEADRFFEECETAAEYQEAVADLVKWLGG